ncbi:MAG TPA: NAD+ synthase [Chloroflexota bacterium]|jgi:NAD+ synthase (glutamine-hydrolysing)|nr:NAD+ synthase [Chloroflexota bacterium]
MRLALAQINSTVGDIAGNTAKIIDYVRRARADGADLVAFPELAVSGYPPEDLLLKPSFLRQCEAGLAEIVSASQDIVVVVGYPEAAEAVYNSAAVICDGRIATVCRKERLPNYGVFDEQRYFRPGHPGPLFKLGEDVFAVNVCEDIWYPTGPASVQAAAGAELIVNINASPFHLGKSRERDRMLATRASDSAAVLAYLNTVGGQDELIFDGQSALFDQHGSTICRGAAFEEDLIVCDVELDSVFRERLRDPRWRQIDLDALPTIELSLPDMGPRGSLAARVEPQSLQRAEEAYKALVLGTRDYVKKNGFATVLIGLSGGIDSSLVATVAADALGPDCVVCVSMPSRYSSRGSRTDAQRLAGNLGVKLHTISIEQAFRAYLSMLEPMFEGTEPNVAEENLQARVRGMILMSISNKFGWLVLTTGNKSEMATGYATLYGDMAGGFAVIKDVPKTLVYDVCEYRNRLAGRDLIPRNVLTKPPSAELAPDQKDEDSLPPYSILDPILEGYVEEDLSFDEIVRQGFDPDVVRRVIRLVDLSEYKRRQAPPGIKITGRAFGRDRRLPITNGFRETAQT